MKPFVLLLACFGLFAADPTPSPQPQPKQASLEEANVILQIRNIISVHRERVAQMEKQLLGQETAIRAKHGISQGCQIGDDGRSFVLYNPDNSTRPCPDALPSVTTLTTKGDSAQGTTGLREVKKEAKK